MKDDAKRYAWFVLAAAGLLCTVYYLVFVAGFLFTSADSSARDHGLGALMLLWVTPLTLAGDWYLTLPAVLVIGAGLLFAWRKLPERVTGWRPHRVWQYLVVAPLLAYGTLSAVALVFLMVVSIPASCAGGPPPR